MVDERDDEKFKGFKSGQKLFSKCVLICVWVLLACILIENALIFGNSKELQQSIEVMWSTIQKRIVILCKIFEVGTGGSGYVLSSYFFVLSSGMMMLRKLDCVICVG